MHVLNRYKSSRGITHTECNTPNQPCRNVIALCRRVSAKMVLDCIGICCFLSLIEVVVDGEGKVGFRWAPNTSVMIRMVLVQTSTNESRRRTFLQLEPIKTAGAKRLPQWCIVMTEPRRSSISLPLFSYLTSLLQQLLPLAHSFSCGLSNTQTLRLGSWCTGCRGPSPNISMAPS